MYRTGYLHSSKTKKQVENLTDISALMKGVGDKAFVNLAAS